jgi:NAD-dependent aldehyde dehydrogenases
VCLKESCAVCRVDLRLDVFGAPPRYRDDCLYRLKGRGLGILKDAGTLMPGQQMVKRVLAEMGGKNAIIVDETADLDDAITGVVSSFTGYAGQKCSACSRAIVHASIYESFLIV